MSDKPTCKTCLRLSQQLMSEAKSIHASTGLTPRQMQEQIKQLRGALQELLADVVISQNSMNKCNYDLAWRGRCNAECEGAFCTEHATAKCAVCGEQATNECSHTGQFVCGTRLCDNCEGHTDTSKPSGGWGFLNHTHRRKQEAA